MTSLEPGPLRSAYCVRGLRSDPTSREALTSQRGEASVKSGYAQPPNTPICHKE